LETTKLTVVCSLVSDIALLIIMLVGLLRMRLETGRAFGVGSILWKQVRWWPFSFDYHTPKFTNVNCRS
jgi:hypothetical protein